MRKIEDLDQVVGGTTLSGALINSFTSFIKILLDVGRGLGSSIRRISENNVCPLE